jgi:hypothetical protein
MAFDRVAKGKRGFLNNNFFFKIPLRSITGSRNSSDLLPRRGRITPLWKKSLF